MERNPRRLRCDEPDGEDGAPRALVRLLAAAGCWGFSFSCFFLLPKFDAGPTAIGLVVGLFGLATVLCTPLAGRWVDARPRREVLSVGALLMSGSAFAFIGVDTLGVGLGVLRVLQGMSYALVLTSVGTLVADLAPPARLSQALGLAGGSMLVMNAIAPAMVEPLADAGGWPAVFALAGVAALVAAGLAAGVTEPSRPAYAGVRPGLLAVARRPVARDYALVVALAGATFGAVMAFEPSYVLALGGIEVRAFFIAFATAAIVVRLLGGHLPDRFGRHRVAMGSLALYALTVAAMVAMRPVHAAALGASLGLAHGLFYPALNALAVTAVAAHERGRIMAIFTGAFSGGVWVGTSGLGLVATHAGYPAVFGVAASSAALALVVLVRSPALRHAERGQLADVNAATSCSASRSA
jgi:MFS family permease